MLWKKLKNKKREAYSKTIGSQNESTDTYKINITHVDRDNTCGGYFLTIILDVITYSGSTSKISQERASET